MRRSHLPSSRVGLLVVLIGCAAPEPQTPLSDGGGEGSTTRDRGEARWRVPCRSEHRWQAIPGCVDLGASVVCVDRDAPDAGRTLSIASGDADGTTIDVDGEWDDVREGESFEVVRVDLDGDGDEEVVIAVPIALRRFDDGDMRLFVVGRAGVTQLEVESWGSGSLIDGELGRCDLLATSHDGFLDPAEGGTGRAARPAALTARPMTYERGELVPRGGEFVQPSAQDATWIEVRGTEPGPVRASYGGTIVDARPAHFGVVLDIELDDGRRVALDSSDGWNTLWWAPTRTRLPAAYVPAEPRRWVGARAMVTCDSPDDRWAQQLAAGEAFRVGDLGSVFQHSVWISPR